MPDTTPDARLRQFLDYEEANGAGADDTPVYDVVGYDLTYGDLRGVLTLYDNARERAAELNNPEDLIAIRQFLRAQGRMRDLWSEADDGGRAFIWTDLHNKADAVAERFHDRIADLDHRAAQLPDHGLATSLTEAAE